MDGYFVWKKYFIQIIHETKLDTMEKKSFNKFFKFYLYWNLEELGSLINFTWIIQVF